MNFYNFKNVFIEILKSQKVVSSAILHDLYEVPEPPMSEKQTGMAELDPEMIFDAFLTTADAELHNVTVDIQAIYNYVVDGTGCSGASNSEDKRNISPLLAVLIDFVEKISYNNTMLSTIYSFLSGHTGDTMESPRMEIVDINYACSEILESMKVSDEILGAIYDIVCVRADANMKISPTDLDSVSNPKLPCASSTGSNGCRNGTYRNY